MADDDLVKPVKGRAKRPSRRPLPLPSARSVAAGLGLAVAALATYLALSDDPLGGQPHVVSEIVVKQAPPTETATIAPAGPGRAPLQQPAQAPLRDGRSTATELEVEAGVSVVRGAGEAAPGSIVIRLADPVSTRLQPAPDNRLVERTRYGLLPKVGAGGLKAADIYARPVGGLTNGAAPQGRIVLVVGGLGISQSATSEAIAKLPGGVTLAFAPYGGDLERHVVLARNDGHEVMLQAPMEPFDYPDNDPGPHTLTVKASATENLDKLHWVMGRFPGYVGVMNFMGARLTADEAAFAPILNEIGGRGLFFLDDGTSPRSKAAELSQAAGQPVLKADIVVDISALPDAIDKELERLEALARQKGTAIGVATALPGTVARLARWAEGLDARGILLVPASAAAIPARKTAGR